MLLCPGSSTEWTGGNRAGTVRSHLYTIRGVSSRRVPAHTDAAQAPRLIARTSVRRFVDADTCFERTAHEVDRCPGIGSGKEPVDTERF